MSMEARKLNLNAYGVEEMSRAEMFHMNGGDWRGWSYALGKAIGWVGGQIANAADAVANIMDTGGEFVQSNVRR